MREDDVHVEEPHNEEIAEALERFASLLAAAGSSSYAVRAYRRVADRIRVFPLPVAPLVLSGRAREIAGVGPGIERRLRELVETGELAEAAELRERLAPELVRKAQRTRRRRGGMLLSRSRAVAERIAEGLDGIVAGDPRRGAELSNRIAIVVRGTEPLDRVLTLPDVIAVAERYGPSVLAVTAEGVPVEIVAAEPGRLGTELVRATGSADWVASLPELPVADGEEEVFAELGMAWIPPELREVGAPPAPSDLLSLSDIRGDLHAHTTWSDGRASVLETGDAARARGYAYLAICDHTEAVRVVPGLDSDALRRQGEEIAAANEALAPFRVLRGIECDILPDGSLDLPDDVLAELDWVQISLHAGQRLERDELTKRVVTAMRHPAARCLSHPKGRILNHRPENALDLDEVFSVALETGVALEVNGLPDRLDLSGSHVAEAIAAGVSIVCSTDAHSPRGLENMELSVMTARRGGAPRDAVLNTRPLAELIERRTTT
jgi:DNA polymerase (family 10)